MNNDLPNIPGASDPLDELLRDANGYIPDNGFTTRVLTSLPAQRKHSWRRFVVLSLAMLIGTVLIAWQLPLVIATFDALPKHWSAFHWQMLAAIVPPLVSIVCVVFAVTNEEE